MLELGLVVIFGKGGDWKVHEGYLGLGCWKCFGFCIWVLVMWVCSLDENSLSWYLRFVHFRVLYYSLKKVMYISICKCLGRALPKDLVKRSSGSMLALHIGFLWTQQLQTQAVTDGLCCWFKFKCGHLCSDFPKRQIILGKVPNETKYSLSSIYTGLSGKVRIKTVLVSLCFYIK